MSASVLQRPRTAGSDFATSNRQIIDAGLLDRRPADVGAPLRAGRHWRGPAVGLPATPR